ncbi:hypothetical protein LJR034_003094 [Caballeronia sp. LjRoot34]|uniref:hypothetical protein n=1 Tax=Caballeronia sp. LjRoot34 TaxID=3342325 RepID=UPI003ED04C40
MQITNGSGRPSHSVVVPIFCAAATAAFFAFIAHIGSLNPINDHAFLANVFQGYPFPGYIDRHLGRFTPLASQEYAWVSRLLSPSAQLFYVVHALKMAASCALLLYCLILLRAGSWLALSLWCSVFFSVGFVYSSVIVQAGELNELLLTLLFIAIVVRREYSQLPTSRIRYVLVLVATLLLIVTFFYKETAFIFALVFGASEVMRSRLAGPRRMPRYAMILLTSGIGYLVFFGLWHGLSMSGSYAESHSTGRSAMIAAYAANDPLIMFVLAPVLCLRIIAVAQKPSRYSLSDSFLVTAAAYAAAYVVLRMYSGYYFLPSYGFAVCGIAGIVAPLRGFVRAIVAAVCALFAINLAPIALSDAAAQSNIARNYSRFTDAVADWVWANPNAGKVPRNLVLLGVSADSHPEIIISLQRFLENTGLSDSLFRIRVSKKSTNPAVSAAFGLTDTTPYQARAGDLLLYNPFQDVVTLPPLRSPDQQIVVRTGAEHTPPRWSVYEWFEQCGSSINACMELVSTNSPYTGYAATLLTRDPAPPQIASLTAPSYDIGPVGLPKRLRAGTTVSITVPVRNAGSESWPAVGSLRPGKYVHMSYVWLGAKRAVVTIGDRTALPTSLRPGDIAQVNMRVNVPSKPGDYTLVLSPIQEDVVWFYQVNPNASGAAKKVNVFQSRLAKFLSDTDAATRPKSGEK